MTQKETARLEELQGLVNAGTTLTEEQKKELNDLLKKQRDS